MQLGYLLIFVEDVQETIAFYEKAFNLKQLFLAESLLYGEMETGHTKLGFVAEKFVASNGVHFTENRIQLQKAPGFQISFTTSDVAKAYQQALSAGCADLHAPSQTAWGQTVAQVRDLNGILVEICTPLP